MKNAVSQLNLWQRAGFVIGIIFLVATLLGSLGSARMSFVSYLVAFLFWFGLAMGCLILAMTHHLTAGDWGKPTRRIFEAGYMTLPVLAVLFIPILFGLHQLFPWADPASVAADKILKQKSGYNNIPCFTLRAVFCFAVWIQIACLLRRWSLQQDTAPDATPHFRAKTLSGPGVVIVPFLATFSYVDWVMSAETAWYSTVFSIISLASAVLVALAFAIVLLARLGPGLDRPVNEKCFTDLGSLLLAFVMFWAYVAFSQLLIIYSGNQPHEIEWYLHRTAGGWKWLIMGVALFQFLVPFLLLLSRSAKKHIRALSFIAALVFFANALDNFWSITPSYYPVGFRVHWTDFTAWLGIGGIWLGIFAGNLKRHPLMVREIIKAEPVLKGDHGDR